MRARTIVWLGLGMASFGCDSGGSGGKVDAKGAAKADETATQTRSESRSESESKSESKSKSEAKSESKSETETKSEAESDTGEGRDAGEPDGPMMKTGDRDEPVSARQSLLVRADGSGEAITGLHLRDPGAVAERLGLFVVPSRFGTAMAAREGGKPALVLDESDATVHVTVSGTQLATPAGVAVGMRYDDIVAKVPDTKCRAEPGEGGEFLYCEVDVGVFAVIEAPKGVGEDWDDAVLDPAKAEKLAGKAKISALDAWYSDVPLPSTKTAVVTALADDKGVLPAGVSWNGDTYPVCETEPTPQRCLRPRAAVVTGVFDEAEAGKQLAAVDRDGLAPGYPLVVHTDELELESADRRGVAIVLALFARPDAAEAWAKSRTSTEVLPIVAQPVTDGGRKRVARLRPGTVPAHAKDELGQIDHGVDPGEKVCELPGGSLAVFEDTEGVVYASIPVTCPDGTKAFVRWWDTMVFTTVGDDPSGKPRAWQLVGAECDEPRFAHWRWANGARVGQPTIVEGDEC